MECPDENQIARYLDGSLPGDARQAVDVHLDGCGACTSLIAELAAVQASGPRTYRTSGARPGRIGRYPVEATLGEGGMGVVYRAQDPTLGRAIALKVVRVSPGLGDTDQQRRDARLVDEAQAMARLSHPNVVPVYELGQADEGLFVAMELVEGQTLRRWLTTAPPIGEIARVVLEAGEGLAAAHSAGVVHRDFKPENVLVGRDGRVRVTDFGLAVLSDVRGAGREVVGTAAYAAPEQLAAAPGDPLADQFAFGVTLYEALFGARPFEGSTVEAVRAAHAAGPARAPKDTRGVADGVTKAILRALALRPDERFPSLRAMLDEVRRALSADDAFHVRAHATLQLVLAPVHLVLGVLLVVTPRPSASSGGGADVPTPTGALDVLWGAVVVAGLLTLVGWLFLGVVWAPLNAWGLARRRPFARASTLIYGVVSLLTCVGIPYGVYAIWSMTRPGVRAMFSER